MHSIFQSSSGRQSGAQGIILWMVLAATLFACMHEATSKEVIRKEVTMVGQSNYPVEHAGPARRCFVASRFSGAGKLVWSSQASGKEADDNVTGLILWDDHPVVTLTSTVNVFTPGGGKLWEHARLRGSPVAVGNGMLYCENRNSDLDAVNLRNELVLDNVPLPSIADAEVRLRLLWPMKKVMLASAFWPGREPDQKPAIFWDRTVYGKRIGDQGENIREWLFLPPLYIPEQDLLCFGANRIECFRTESGDKAATFDKPCESLVDWHADADGAFCFTGYLGRDKTQKALVRLMPTGAEAWRWVDSEGTDRWVEGQPPVWAPGERLYALTERRLLAFKNGTLAWQYESRETPLRRGTSLADGSILVTAGNKLLHLTVDGKVRVSVVVDGEILTSPVVDAQGHIYVATQTHLIRID
jgi:outer membrane protein assembly factor BamB